MPFFILFLYRVISTITNYIYIMFKVKEKIIDLGDGRQIILQTGKLARQAGGAVLLKMGKTMILATVVSAKEAKEETDFMPLSVEYKEKFASAGRIPGGFQKKRSQAF